MQPERLTFKAEVFGYRMDLVLMPMDEYQAMDEADRPDCIPSADGSAVLIKVFPDVSAG